MLPRWLPRVLFLFAAAAFALAAWWYVHPPEAGPDFVVEAAEQTLNGLEPGQEYEVRFPVHNRTGRPMRVIGAEYT